MKIYVKANSKVEINRGLAEGKTYTGVNYSFFGDGGIYELNSELPIGTVIAIYSQMSGGNPVAKSWGTWNGKVLK